MNTEATGTAAETIALSDQRIRAGIVIECPHDMTMQELRKLFPVGVFRYIWIRDGEYRIVRRQS